MTVALVTGATRGAGLAIAQVLGERGATVYAAGRSSRTGSRTEDLPGTVEDAAQAVDERGGTGVAARCDFTDDAQVGALLERIRAEQGGLDLLVNNAWGGYEHHEGEGFTAPFWEQPLRHWEGMFVAGVRAHLLGARHAAPLMIERGRGLIVSTVAWSFGDYLGNVLYDVAKAAIVRMAFAMSRDLQGSGVTALALAPGFMRTERVMNAHARQPFDLSPTESPYYLGRAVAALAGDREVARFAGQVVTVGELAREYGFTDADGTQPPPFRVPARD